MKNYVIYIRVSTQKQGHSGLGLEAQQEMCEQYIRSVDGNVSAIFRDVESGKSRTRKGLWSAIDHCKETGETLVIAKLDRLARDIEFTFKVINTGIDIHFVDMPVVNTIILGVFASVSQYERELTSTRTKAALTAKKARGEQTGGTNDLWGKNTGADRTEAIYKMSLAAAEVKSDKARKNPHNIAFKEFIEDWQEMYGKMSYEMTDWDALVKKLNLRGKKTASGMEFNVPRAKAMYQKVVKLYNL